MMGSYHMVTVMTGSYHYNSKPNGDGDWGHIIITVNLMVTVMTGSYHYNSKPNGTL